MNLLKTLIIFLIASTIYFGIYFFNKEEIQRSQRIYPIHSEDINLEETSSLLIFSNLKTLLSNDVELHWYKTYIELEADMTEIVYHFSKKISKDN